MFLVFALAVSGAAAETLPEGFPEESAQYSGTTGDERRHSK